MFLEGLVLGSLLPDALTCAVVGRAVGQLRTSAEGTAVCRTADNSGKALWIEAQPSRAQSGEMG